MPGVSVETRIGQQPSRQAANDAARLPELSLVANAPAEADRRAWVGALSRLFDRLIGLWSLVPLDPVLDTRAFPWTQVLRDNWRAIRDEAIAAGFRDFGSITRGALDQVPGLVSARFATLAPGTHLDSQRGASKALMTCHLGLVVPRDGDVRMRIEDRTVRWAEGETLVFDDSYAHEAWNDAANPRIVLSLRFERPLRQPGAFLADRLLHLLRLR